MTQIRPIALVTMCAILIVAGCSRRVAPAVVPTLPPPPLEEEAPPSPPTLDPAPEPTTAPTALTEDDIFAGKTLEQLNAERPLGDVLFDFDETRIRDEARVVLQNNAEWLQRWPSTRVTIEGHCDSRGTSEYNLALGDRRASAVKEYLVSLGVDATRLLIVSKGEESLVCFEEHESCWQQNRRGHHIITAK